MLDNITAVQNRISDIQGRFSRPGADASAPDFSAMYASRTAAPTVGTLPTGMTLPTGSSFPAGSTLPISGAPTPLPELPADAVNAAPLPTGAGPIKPMPVDGYTLQPGTGELTLPDGARRLPPLGGASVSELGAGASPTSGDYGALIQGAAQKYGVDPKLVKAVVHAESGFNAHAVSGVGAQGLMQLMPGTARAMGVKDSFDPAQNIDGGTRYLKGLLDQFGGDATKAIAAYNAGPHAVTRYGGVPPFPETQSYVRKVQNFWANG